MHPEYFIFILSYLLGSIPFGFLLVRSTEGKDIPIMGNGSIGATNVLRRSRWAGILTLILDAGKGYLAVIAAGWITGNLHWQASAAAFFLFGAYIFREPVPILLWASLGALLIIAKHHQNIRRLLSEPKTNL